MFGVTNPLVWMTGVIFSYSVLYKSSVSTAYKDRHNKESLRGVFIIFIFITPAMMISLSPVGSPNFFSLENRQDIPSPFAGMGIIVRRLMSPPAIHRRSSIHLQLRCHDAKLILKGDKDHRSITGRLCILDYFLQTKITRLVPTTPS